MVFPVNLEDGSSMVLQNIGILHTILHGELTHKVSLNKPTISKHNTSSYKWLLTFILGCRWARKNCSNENNTRNFLNYIRIIKVHKNSVPQLKLIYKNLHFWKGVQCKYAFQPNLRTVAATIPRSSLTYQSKVFLQFHLRKSFLTFSNIVKAVIHVQMNMFHARSQFLITGM